MIKVGSVVTFNVKHNLWLYAFADRGEFMNGEPGVSVGTDGIVCIVIDVVDDHDDPRSRVLTSDGIVGWIEDSFIDVHV